MFVPTERGVGRIAAAVLVIVLVVVALGAVLYLYGGKTSPSTTTPTTTTSTTSTTRFPTSLVVEEGEQPDSVDPAVEFTTSGNEVTFNVYQGLVAPLLQSTTQFVGVLAQNWTASANGMTWTFGLRHNVTFSNGDPFNAYVMWYSLYRSLVMNQVPSFILAQNFGATNGAEINVTDAVLNSIDYAQPSAANLTMMQAPDQSFQVVNHDKIALHLGYGYNGNVTYSAFMVTLTAPIAFAVDPKVVAAHGGVVAGQPNTWMQTHALGTGFYLLDSWTQGQDIKFVKNPNYWGSAYQGTLNYAIKPAVLDTILIYYKPTSSRIVDLKSGFAQIITAPDVTEAADLGALQQTAHVNVTVYPIEYGSAYGAYFLFMNPYVVPAFNNVLVREAISYAVDYRSIIKNVFRGLADQWIGPVPPGYPFYNETTSGLTYYQFDAAKAASLLAQAGYTSKLPNGTTLNPSGKTFPTLSFVYTPDSVSETQVSAIVQSELQAIGIQTELKPMAFAQYTTFLFSAPATNSTDGFGISYWSEDYPASQDYVTGIAGSNYTGGPTYLDNVSGWTTAAATAPDDATILSAFRNATVTMQNQYVDIWLYVPKFIAVNYDNVAGMVPNLDGPCAGYFMYYNSVHYTS